MNTKIYYDKDGNISDIEDKIAAMIGYGNQGRSQALNMRDSGLTVIIGNRDDIYKRRAINDNFEVYSIPEAVKKADFLFFLIPDEIMSDVFKNEIKPNLKPNQSLIFASGYNIAFDLIKPPQNVDVLLVAPRMIGIGVRERFLNKKGYFSFIGVDQDSSGNAKKNLLALCKALGTLYLGGIETTFKEEAVLDLFTEQGYGPPFGTFMMKTMTSLIKAGYPEEAILGELLLSGQMKYLYKKITEGGISKYFQSFPKRTQYGTLSRAIEFNDLSEKIFEIQKNVLEHIENGGFATEWEKKVSKLKFKVIKFFAPKIGFGRTEVTVRKNLGFPNIDMWAEVPYPTAEDIRNAEKIQEELAEFKDFNEY